MSLLLCGISHKTAPLDIRQAFAFTPEARKEIGQKLTANPAISEAAVLCTCNRTEVLLAVAEESPSSELILQKTQCLLTEKSGCTIPAESFYSLAGARAIQHFFEVAASLDSMVVGEAQILGQVKEAYREAQEMGTLGSVLHKLFQKAFTAAKRVRTQTQIGANPVSLAGVAVAIAESIFETLDNKTVMLIGSGKMAYSALTALRKYSLRKLFVSGRNTERTRALAEQLRGEPLGMDGILAHLNECDLIVVSTSSRVPLLCTSDIQRIRKGNPQPLFILDISVPRNVEKSAHELENVFVYDMDDIQQVIEQNRESRETQMVQAKAILEDETEKFKNWLGQRKTAALVQALTDKAEQIRLGELKAIEGELGSFTSEQRAVVEAATRSMMNKLIHDPLVLLKQRQIEDPMQSGYSIVQAFKTLFHLRADEHEL